MKKIGIILGAAVIALAGYIAPLQAEQKIENSTAKCCLIKDKSCCENKGTTECCQINTKEMASAEKKPQAKLIEVRVCPITQATVKGKGTGSEVVGKYKVYFCCGGCSEAFDKLTPAQKLQKAEEAYLIQQNNEKKSKQK